MAWFNGNQDLSFHSHSFVGDVQEFDVPFHNSYNHPYHQPSFQTHHPPHPPYIPYHEPSPPSYHPPSQLIQPLHSHYQQPSHSPYPSYTSHIQSTFQPSPSPYHELPPQHHNHQPCGLSNFFTSPNMKTLTSALTRKYEEIQEPYLQLLMNNGSSKEIEEIEEFFKAYYDHISWVETGGEYGTPWHQDLHEEEQGTQAQEPNPTSQVESSQPLMPQSSISIQAHEVEPLPSKSEESLLPFGNDPILIEVDSPTTLIDNEVDVLSDIEVDEEIVCESPHEIEIANAQPIDSSGSDVIENVDDFSPTSLCDALTCENASIHSTRDDFDELNEFFPCSCDEDHICVECFYQKRHLLVEFQRKACNEVVDSTINHDAPSCTIDDCKHEHFENVDSCMDAIDVDENEPSIKSYMHDVPIGLVTSSLVDNKDSKVLIDKIPNVDESFQQVLSCDLPPDLVVHCSNSSAILHESSSSSTLLPSTSCDCKSDVVYPNTKLDSAPSTLQMQEDFKNQIVSLTPFDGSNVDFLGCDSYLESFDPNLFTRYSRSFQVYLFGLGTAPGLLSLQEHNWKSHMWYQPPPYILGPLPIDPKPPPPPRKINQGEVCTLKTIMFLILDENFSFKRLKRP